MSRALCRAVLENHHLYTAFSAMREPGQNPIAHFNYTQTKEFRMITIELVLATDFAVHLKLINQFRTLVAAGTYVSAGESIEDSLLIWKTIVKCADLGHCSKPLQLHKKWSYRIMEEMYRQGDNEARLGAVVTPAMDRSKLDSAAKLQSCFLEFVVLPLFQAWNLFAVENTSLAQLEANIKSWKTMDDMGACGCCW